MTKKFEETLLELKQRILRLDAIYNRPITGSTIREMIEVAYGRYLTASLKNAMESNDLTESELAERLTLILKHHWDVVRGSFLCYTSQPNSECTAVLLELAHWVCRYDHSQGLFSALLTRLMPSIQAISTTRTHLDVVYYEDETTTQQAYPVPDFKNEIQSITDIEPFKQMLYTHVLSADGESLIPVSLLLELTLDAEKRPLIKPYIPSEKEEEVSAQAIPTHPAAPINQTPDSEFNRLIHHTPLTRHILKAQQDYEGVLSQNVGSLNNALRALGDGLFAGSSHGGEGQTLNASEKSYAAIIEFMEYYNRLPKAVVEQIPSDLLKIIDNIQLLGSDRRQNDMTKITTNVQTCVGVMAGNIRKQVRRYEKELNQIGVLDLNDPQRLKAIHDAKLDFSKAKSTLRDAIANHDYAIAAQEEAKTGAIDKLDMTIAAIQTLGVKAIFDINPEPLTRGGPEAFKQWMRPLPSEIQAQFYRDLRPYWVHIIKDIKDCKNILDFVRDMNPEFPPVVLASLENHWPQIVHSIQDFITIQTYIGQNPAQIKALIRMIRPSLITWLQNITQYTQIKPYLSHDEHLDFLSELEKQNPTLWLDIIKEPFFDTLKNMKIRVMLQMHIAHSSTDKLGEYFKNGINRLEQNNWHQVEASVITDARLETERSNNERKSRAHAQREVRIYNGNERKYTAFKTNEHMRKQLNTLKTPFVNAKKDGLLNAFMNQIDQCNILDFLTALFQAHPWIRRDPSGAIVQSFLYDSILKYLIHHLLDARGNIITLISMTPPYTQLQWKALTPEWIANQAKLYPYTDSATFKIPLYNYPSLENHTRHSPENWINHAFSRIDVLRYLYRSIAKETNRQAVNNKADYLPIKLVLLSELEALTPVDRENTLYFVINLATEEEPCWIGIQQQANQCILYRPSHHAGDIHTLIEQTLPDLKRVFPTLILAEISCDHNLALNDFNSDLTSKTIWHTLLFTRILAAGNTVEPNAFRQYLPLYLLIHLFYSENYEHYENHNPPVKLLNTFLTRHPFSSNHVTALKTTTPTMPFCTDDIPGSPESLFDEHLSCYPTENKSSYTLEVNKFSIKTLLSALYILHHSPQIQTFFMPHKVNTTNLDDPTKSRLRDLLNTNPNILEMGSNPIHSTADWSPLYRYLECIAARNQYLQMIHPEFIDIRTSISDRQKLWTYAGQEWLKYFQGTAARLATHDRTAVANTPFDGLSNTQKILRQWQAVGILGVKQLFDAMTASPATAPKLQITFDLGASNIEDPFEAPKKPFIASLTECIQSYKGPSPLFESVSLILPDSIDEALIPALSLLVNSIQKQFKPNHDRPNELFFYHVPIHLIQKILKPFVNTQATPDAMKLLIPRIPELDENAFSSMQDRVAKTHYRNVQNDVLQFWRKYNREAPIEAMQNTVILLEKNQLPPTVFLMGHNELGTLSWGSEEVWTPLVEDFGTQIQVEMEQEQQHHVTTTYETKPILKHEEPPVLVTPITLIYGKPKEPLITRENIDRDPRFLACWNRLSPEQRAQYGGSGKALFGFLFGQKPAEHLIAHVEFSALERLLPHIPQLLGGFDRDNRIAGFELALHNQPKMIEQRRVRDIVLCFDLEKEKIALAEYESKAPQERNPYTLHLTPLPKINDFLGSFRQLSTLSPDPRVQQTFYQFFATEEPNENALNPAGDHALCLAFLKDWVNDPSLDCLFDIHHEGHLTTANLKSLGQLFYQYGAQEGLRNVFRLAHQIIQTAHLGEAGLIHWKRYFLDKNPHWSTCLDQDELEAISLSMSTLKNNRAAQAIWWLIVEAHVNTVGYSTYRSLWYAYQTCMGYLSDRQLTLDVEVIKQVLAEKTPFNAQIFLEKLHVLLHTHAKTLDGHALSQHLLNTLKPSDLDRDGPIYAILYEHYPFMAPSLKLTHLTTTSNSPVPTYVVSWGADEKPTDPITHALRYACLRGRLDHQALSALEWQLENHFRPLINNPQIMQVLRIYLGCVTSGINTVHQSVKNEVSALLDLDPQILSFIHRGIRLPDVVQKNSLDLDWHDVLTLAQAISKLGLLPLIEDFSVFKSEALINACGRAIQCYRSHAPDGSNGLHALLHAIKTQTQPAFGAYEESKEEGALQEFKETDADLQTPAEPDWDHPLLQHYPWLLASTSKADKEWLQQVNRLRFNEATPGRDMTTELAQCLMLQKQLRTLRFDDTPYLPDLPALQDAFFQIKSALDPEATRRRVVSTWKKKGLKIRLQDTRYAPLSQQEITDAMVYLDNHLEPNFKTQNKALCKRFIEAHIALPTQGHRQHDLMAFLEQCCRQVDNKKHYNELGVLLGHLIKWAKADKTQTQKWYSAKQLTDILQLLIHSDRYKIHHYPCNLLGILIHSPIASTLVSSDLNQLEQGIKAIDLRNYIQDLTDNQTMSNPCKEIALEYATRGDDNECRVHAELAKDLLTELSKDRRLKPSYIDLLNQLLKEHRLQIQDYATWQQKHAIAFRLITDPNMQSFWQDMQIKWETQLPEPIRALFSIPVNTTQVYIQLILVQILSKKELTGHVDDLRHQLIPVKTHLSTWGSKELESLIQYCFSDKRLTLGALHVLFTDFNALFVPTEQPWQSFLTGRNEIPLNQSPPFDSRRAKEVIHFFESVFMARGHAARHYSMSEDEQLGLLRVLSSIKRKKRGYISQKEVNQLIGLFGYCNAFSIAEQLEKKDEKTLKDMARTVSMALKNGVPETDRLYYKMQILACIREMNLRKKSIWNNHNQMIALIYLAIHGDDIGIIQKIATGEGKSVVTPQRAIYLALSGKIVDIISAKEILSERDCERDAPLIQAFGFPVSHHITPASPVGDYEKTDNNGGAIHYFNLGNFALFLCEVIASRHQSFHLYPKNRVAFLDEADYQLLDERMLQYNYSKQQGNAGIYNHDEWVFRAVCTFYMAHHQKNHPETHFRTNESGQLCISNIRHLKPLCEYIQALSITAPKQSTFIQQTLIPAIHGMPNGMQALDRVLRQHLSACHSAYCLELDKHFYIGQATRQVGESVINIRFPYVMIDNQPKEDSTYCNGTHQYLQTRLSLEAAEQGEAPDFFVDPLSDILFSLNPVSILNTLFEKREGSTGTPGGDDEHQYYLAAHQIQEVMKMPTHQLSNSTRLPTVFAQNKEEQTTAIAAHIAKHQDRPFLIDCENDADVKTLSKAIGAVCQVWDEHYKPAEHFIVDTLDTGQSEADFLHEAGKKGSVLYSARVGRGTDIRCDHEQGLFVIETGGKPKRKSKQIRGRQARHGDPGTIQAIIDFGCIQNQYDDWMNSPLKSRFEHVLNECRVHLDQKIAKHAKDDAIFWRAFDEWTYREQFLKTEAVETFKYRLNQDKIMKDAERNTLISNLSLEVTRVISRLNSDTKNHKKIESLERKFSELLMGIKELWNKHQNTTQPDDEQRHAFLNELNAQWLTFCNDSSELGLDENAIQSVVQARPERPMDIQTNANPLSEIAPVSELFNLVMSLLLERLGESFKQDAFGDTATQTILGRSLEKPYFADLAAYIGSLQALMNDIHHPEEIKDLLKETLDIMESNTFYSVKFKTHHHILDQYQTILARDIDRKNNTESASKERDTRPHILWLQGLSAFFKQPLLGQKPAGLRAPDELNFITDLAQLMVNTITTAYCYESEAMDFKDDPSVLFIEALSDALASRFSTNSAEINPLMERLRLLLTQDASVSSLMTRHLMNTPRLPYMLQVLSQDNRPDFDTRMKSFQENILMQKRSVSAPYLNDGVTRQTKREPNRLEDYPDVIPLLFDIVFRNDEHQAIHSADLPAICPSCFDEHEEAQTITDFWTILAKHAPTSIQDRDAFIEALAAYPDAQDRKNVLQALKNIPDPVHLSHINALIKNLMPSDVTGMLANIALYAQQSNIWFDVLKSKHLVVANGPFWRPNLDSEAQFNHLVDVFHSLSPEDSAYFFDNPTFCSFETNDIKQLAMTFIAQNATGDRLERAELNAISELFKHIKASPSPHQATLEAIFKEGLSHSKGLYQDRNRLILFTDALKTLPKAEPIDENTIRHLWMKWRTNEIPNNGDLDRVVALLKIMQTHSAGRNQIDRLFTSHVSKKIIEERIFLMQCLNQDLLRFEDPRIMETYNRKLQILVTHESSVHPESYFRRLFHITQQLFLMQQPLFKKTTNNIPNRSQRGNMHAVNLDHGTLMATIKQAKTAYGYCFFQSKDRAETANALFDSLETNNRIYTHIDIIKSILSAKEKTLSSAGNQSKWSLLGRGPIDAKGYSRLYQITSSLLSSVIQTYLKRINTETDLKKQAEYKKELYCVLEQHYIQEMSQLTMKLDALNTYSALSTLLKEIQEELNTTHSLTKTQSHQLACLIGDSKKTAPSYLQYLLDEMLILCELAEPPSNHPTIDCTRQ